MAVSDPEIQPEQVHASLAFPGPLDGKPQYDQVSGSGHVRLGKDGRLRGKFRIKQGDDSNFIAEGAREPSRMEPGCAEPQPRVLGKGRSTSPRSIGASLPDAEEGREVGRCVEGPKVLAERVPEAYLSWLRRRDGGPTAQQRDGRAVATDRVAQAAR